MQPHYLLAGSFAYDTVLQHPQAFRQRILADELDKLNVSFHVESVVESFGGCAGNIAFNASLLGDKPVLVGNLGHDGGRYLSRIDGWGLDSTTLGIIQDQPTAHAWMLTDERANQIISFHAGAMKARVLARSYSTPTLWHIAPEDPMNMVKLALAARESASEYLFDPGQALPALLEGAAQGIVPLLEILDGSKGIFVNEYEYALLETAVSLRRYLANPSHFMVVTRGATGIELYQAGRSAVFFLPAKAKAVVDPTGCGDAFRAGFLHAHIRGQALPACVSLGAVMGALAVGSEGGQNHHATQLEIYEAWARYNGANNIKTLPGTFDVLSSAGRGSVQ